MSNVRKLRLAFSTSPATRASCPRTVKYPSERLTVCCARAASGENSIALHTMAVASQCRRDISCLQLSLEQRRCQSVQLVFGAFGPECANRIDHFRVHLTV